jgi:preprotein translocase subunit SecA
MTKITLKTKLKHLYQRLNGCTIEYDLSIYVTILNEIKQCGQTLKNMTPRQLLQMSERLKSRILDDGLPDCHLVEAFALVREATWRTVKLRPFDVQLLGALVMHQGKLAEMQTGEGKTLTAVFPAYLSALSGQGVHILTFNDYLARRDARWMGPIYQFLGLKVGYIQEGMSIKDRQNAYAADITYLTAKEAGFDYLRDSLCYQKDKTVHRSFNYAIIDEADSILIDEARIPLVIAGTADDYLSDTYYMTEIVRKLEEGIDFEFDEYARNIHLTDFGQNHVERLFRLSNLYAAENYELLIRLNCALHAEFLLHRDVDYIIRNGKIELVDEFTGRVADKRRWPDGLQAAIEAKENVNIQSRGNILNSITLQHFIQYYPKICGMTATARSAEEEFRLFYNLHIVLITPNKPCIRIDHQDVLFGTKVQKERAIIDEIIRVHKTRRPILVGTQSVEESGLFAKVLQDHGVECAVLNAKRDEYEAQIIAQAGKLDAVTISTNMAGRGTDIRLGGSDEKEKQQVLELGGLYVIGTNKHESQRIDQQLRGRAGRQGDPGASRYFISLHDDLYIKYRLNELLPAKLLPIDQNGKIDNPIIRREATRIQRICEGQNLEIKKTLNKYSALIEKQRTILFNRRKDILNNQSASVLFKQKSPEKYKQYHSLIGEKNIYNICQLISLYFIDNYWQQYLAEISEIRESIHLKRVGGQDPFVEFQKLAIKIFDELIQKLDERLIKKFNSIQIDTNNINLEKLGIKAPSATWTYLINDNPFEHNVGMQLIGDTGAQIGAVIMTPFLALHLFFKKKKRTLK